MTLKPAASRCWKAQDEAKSK